MSNRKQMSLAAAENAPLYKQVYLRFRHAIANGTLPPGSRVPSIRGLAADLKLSRNTVEAAYDLLIGESFFVTRGQAGTIVSPQLKQDLVRSACAERAPSRSARPTAQAAPPRSGPRPFQLGLPALDAFPHRVWSKLKAQCLRLLNEAAMTHPAPAGWAPLRQAISSHLQISRGIACAADQVFITSGYRGALHLIAGTLLHPGDSVWIEDPCFPPTRQMFDHFGARLVAVPVDEEGIDVAAGMAHGAAPRLITVTPTHQSPLGSTLSLHRRIALLDLAERADAWIIEDDYDSEFRYDGNPLPALSRLDSHGRVLYVGTFSKVLYPSLRLAYLVVPPALVPQFEDACPKLQDGCSTLDQAVVADFIVEGHFAKHLKKMRRLYAERRRAVIDGMRDVFGDRLQFSRPACGLHLLARLADDDCDVTFTQQAQAQGFAIEPLSQRYVQASPGQGLLMGFANIEPAAARSLATALRAAGGG